MFKKLMKNAQKLGKQALALAPKIAYSLPALAGLALIAFGVALINLPAGIIVGGLALIWVDSRL